MGDKIEFISTLEFIGNVNAVKDCLMSQEKTEDPKVLWFNIDVPKGHEFRPGDRVRVTVEKL